MKIKDRFGVLVVERIDGDGYYVSCLAHPDRRPMRLTAQQLSTAIQCLVCYSDAAKQRQNVHKLTGRTFGGYVAIKCMGLSSGATTVHENQKQWRGTTKLNYNTYCRHKYWLCYCVRCHVEREMRGDVLRSGRTPKCKCKEVK